MSDKYIIGFRSTITDKFESKTKGPRYTGLNVSVEADSKKSALEKAKQTDQYKKNVKEYKSRVGKEMGTGERVRISHSVLGPAPKKLSKGTAQNKPTKSPDLRTTGRGIGSGGSSRLSSKPFKLGRTML